MKHKRDGGLALVINQGNDDEQGDMAIAQEVVHVLNRHYPGHPWQVDVQGRGIVVRHALISLIAGSYLRREGFSYLMPRERMGTPKKITKAAVWAGGSMLELFNLPRGADTGKLPEIPNDWKPKQAARFA